MPIMADNVARAFYNAVSREMTSIGLERVDRAQCLVRRLLETNTLPQQDGRERIENFVAQWDFAGSVESAGRGIWIFLVRLRTRVKNRIHGTLTPHIRRNGWLNAPYFRSLMILKMAYRWGIDTLCALS